MTDVGHPFSRPFQGLIDALEESLREGVEQPAVAELLFRRDTAAYELRGPVHHVYRVTGVRSRAPAVFERDVHYRYASGRLVWLSPPQPSPPAWYPDDNSWLTVEYTYRDLPSGITDFNAGSVTGTLVRAVARELKFLYEQMDQAYRRAFIDVAEAEALDNVVALLGVARLRALPASGNVTFFLRKPPKSTVTIPARTRVTDPKGRVFLVTEGGVIEPLLDELARRADGTVTVRTANRIGALEHVRARGGTADLPTRPTAPGKPYGPDGRTVTLQDAAGSPPPGELVVRYRPISVTVPVVAEEPGPEGNLGSGSLTVMPTPPRGVDGGVVNEEPLTGGREAERDDQLRERAKHELERAGKATLNALRYAILEIEGVEGVEVRDHGTDESIPLGEVRVRYSGGDPARIQAAIDDNRAAGVVVRAEAITTVVLSGVLYAVPDPGFSPDAAAKLKGLVVQALRDLAIGEAVYVRRLTALAYQVAGLADVVEAQLHYARKPPGETDPSDEGGVDDPFVVQAGELIRPDAGALDVVVLERLSVSDACLTGENEDKVELTIRALDASGLPVRFHDLRLDVNVVLKARPATAPDQPTQRIWQTTQPITFEQSDTTVLSLPASELRDAPGRPGFRPGLDGHHGQAEFQVSASAYPVLAPGLAPVDLEGLG